MKKDSANIDKTLHAYFRGEANAGEIKRLLEWLDESPDNKKQYDILQDFWEKASLKADVERKEYLYSSLRSKIDNELRSDTSKHIHLERRRPAFFNSFRGIAASAAVIGAMFAGYLAYDREQRKELITAPSQPSLIVSQTKAGEKSRLILSDGTIVWLNSESKLTYPPSFKEAQREVSLSGEAFFEVAKDIEKPFVVNSESVSTTALGTSFNVSSFEEDENIIVSLVTGKVKISVDGGETYFLEPGYQMNYKRSGNNASKSNFNISNVISWKDGILIFNQANFQEVRKKLERWYAVKIDAVGEPPADFVITGQFSRNESLELALENMRYGRHFNYQINGKQVTIDFN